MHSPILQTCNSLHSELGFRTTSVHCNNLISFQHRSSSSLHPISSCYRSRFLSTSRKVYTPAAVSSPRANGTLSSLSGKAALVRVTLEKVAFEESVQQEEEGKHGLSSSSSDAANVLEILKVHDKFRYHKVPKLKALKLKLEPALVLEILRHNEVKPSNAWKFFVWAKKQMGYKHTGETYNTVIVTLLEIRKFTSIYYLLEDMYREGVSLTAETCVRMAKTFGSAGMVERAIHALNHMTRLGSPATARHLNALVAELLKSQHHYKAYIAYRELAKTGCEPDGLTFKLLFRELARVGKLELGCNLFDDMQARGCEPDAETASIIIVGILCRAARIEDAVLVFEKVKQKGIRLNANVYNSLLDGLVKTSKVEKALEILEEMHAHGFTPERDSSAALNDLLVASGREQDAQRCRGYTRAEALASVGELAS